MPLLSAARPFAAPGIREIEREPFQSHLIFAKLNYIQCVSREMGVKIEVFQETECMFSLSMNVSMNTGFLQRKSQYLVETDIYQRDV